MRTMQSNKNISVRAIAGTHVILLAIKASERMYDDLRGFAISRSVKGSITGKLKTIFDRQSRWLTGIKYFKGTVQDPQRGGEYSSYEQPFQSFFWSDYAAIPGTTYDFTIVPKLGKPGALKDGENLTVTVTTEQEDDGKHGVWFNRGIVASHKMSEEFKNKRLTDDMANNVGNDGMLRDKEVRWLSRGLAEASLRLINTTAKGDGLRVCAYEFTWKPVLEALRRAHERGVDVEIIYHGDDKNQQAVDDAGLPREKLHLRTKPQIPHNKFIVLLKGNTPRAVWMGSTNFTSTGFFGQTNVGHLVTDDRIAEKYLIYWSMLKDDPTRKPSMEKTVAFTPNPPNVLPENSITPFYSPRIFDNMLDWYCARLRDACSLSLMTIPFNVARQILEGLDTAKDSLRLVVLENEPTKEVKEAERRNRGETGFLERLDPGQDRIPQSQGRAHGSSDPLVHPRRVVPR